LNYVDCVPYGGYAEPNIRHGPATVLGLGDGDLSLTRVSETDVTANDFAYRCSTPQNNAGTVGTVSADADSDSRCDGRDNCPSVANADQQNADAAIGNGKGLAGDDNTVPNAIADSEGDACETDGDADNDGLPDGSDPDPGGDVTYDDDADGVTSPPYGGDPSDDGPSWDSDENGLRDGASAACASASTSADTDGDGLIDSWEVCKWGSGLTISDSDGDGSMTDCEEVIDTNGDGAKNFGDVTSAATAALLSGPAFGKDGDFDVNGDAALNFGDVTTTASKALLGPQPMGGCKNVA
jgi:hypothetical protein